MRVKASAAQYRIEGPARAHRRRGLFVVGQIIAVDIDGRSLGAVQFADNRLLVGRQCSGQFGEALFQLGVLVLPGQGLGPVERQIEVAAAIVEFVDFARGRLALEQKFGGGAVERCG